MKNKFISFYSILISLLYVFSIGYFVYNISTEYKYGTERAKRRFEHMQASIENSSSTRQIEDAIGNLDDFAFLKIENGKNVIFSYPSNISELPAESKLIKNYFSSTENFDITASLYVLRPVKIHNYSKVSFLIIFISTAFTILLIIYLNIFKDDSSNSTITELEIVDEENTEEKQENSDENPLEELVEEQTETPSEVSKKVNTLNDIKSKLSETQVEEIQTEEIKTDEEQEVKEVKQEEIPAETKISETENQIIDDSHENLEENQNLPEDYSKPVEIITNDISENSDENDISAGNKSEEKVNNSANSLEFRLEKEISRAISSEVDLSLLLIRIPELSMETSLAKDIYNIIVEEFQYKDLVFEFSNDCFAGIKLNKTIDEAIDFADKLNHSINNTLSENKNCFIGIAARTLRMVSAKRLILEAKEALVHAQQDTDSPIVAFKVDSEKYMKFMEE